MRMEVYNAVVNSLNTTNAKHQDVAKALVIVMLEDPLRSQLLGALSDQGTPEVRADAARVLEQEAPYRQEETQLVPTDVTPQSTSSDHTNVDAFWCESSGDHARTVAETFKGSLEAGLTSGRVRVRMSPGSIRKRPGYGTASGYEIRFEDDKRRTAIAFKEALDSDVLGDTIRLVPINPRSSTPGYLSLFICPGS